MVAALVTDLEVFYYSVTLGTSRLFWHGIIQFEDIGLLRASEGAFVLIALNLYVVLHETELVHGAVFDEAHF